VNFTTNKFCAIAGAALATFAATPASAANLALSYGTTAGVVNAVAVAALTTPNQFVTAVRNSNLDLEAIVWFNNTATSQVQRLGSFTSGNIPGSAAGPPTLSVVGIANNQFVTAFENEQEALELIVFSVDSSGNIARKGSVIVAAPIASLALTALDGAHVATVTTNGATETATLWAVDPLGNIAQQGSSWSVDDPSVIVGVVATSSSQIVVAQFVPNPGGIMMFSLSVNPSSLSLQDAVFYNTGYADNGVIDMLALGGGNFAMALENGATNLDIAQWTVTTAGVMSQLTDNRSYPTINAVGLAAVGGLPFTITATFPGLFGDLFLEANVWGGSASVAMAIDTDFVCTPDDGCIASAAGLGGTQVATASAAAGADLHVDIWKFQE
jgi:hypothetical protein